MPIVEKEEKILSQNQIYGIGLWLIIMLPAYWSIGRGSLGMVQNKYTRLIN